MVTLTQTPSDAVSAPTEAPLLLCVEDEAAFLELMARELRYAGYRVLTARSPHEALEHFRREREGISLVISDLRMPGGTALDLFAQMKAIGPAPRLLVCTGLLLAQMHDTLRSAGLTRYLFKPFRVPELLRAVRRNLAA